MKSEMFPSSTEFPTRSVSPQVLNFSTAGNYEPGGDISLTHDEQHQHQLSQSHQKYFHHPQIQLVHQREKLEAQLQKNVKQKQIAGVHSTSRVISPSNSNHQITSMSLRQPKKMMISKTRPQPVHHFETSAKSMNSGADIKEQHRSDLIFTEDLDSIEFSMPSSLATSNAAQEVFQRDMLLIQGQTNNSVSETIMEKRRHAHSRKSSHKEDVEHEVKWSRKNIAATMERFEPTTQSSSSGSSLEYGFAAGVISPLCTPIHHPQSFNIFSGTPGPYNSMYSYAYYEPGAIKCHTNIPNEDESVVAAGSLKSPPRNSIRALLAKGFSSKSRNGLSTSSSPLQDERHTYTTRYGTTENLYEEVSEQKIRKVLSDNRITQIPKVNVKEELRRVQHNHFRVLDELNLSLEALIMPPTPPDTSPNNDDDEPLANRTAVSASPLSSTNQRPKKGGLLGGASSSSACSQQTTSSHVSLENLSTTLNSMELKDHAHSTCINPDFDEGDLDSGFSGSGSSSGASYNESLRYYKAGNNINIQATTLPHILRSCRSSTTSGTSTSKSSMMGSSEDHNLAIMSGMIAGCGATPAILPNTILPTPFELPSHCSESQRISSRSLSASSATGTKPKKNFWSIKP